MPNVMERINFDYSIKNIATASKSVFCRKLIEKTELFIKRKRWRTFFYLNPNAKAKLSENYGFKSRLAPPVVDELKEFKEKLTDLITHVEFKQTKNHFRQQLHNDIKVIKSENKLIIAADKTNNFYQITPASYDELLHKNIQKTYKKSEERALRDINIEAKNIASKLQLDDRVEKMANKAAYITLKDHKPNFNNNPSCSLKDDGIQFNINWKILTEARAYTNASKKCHLCTKEKYYILFQPELSTLNSRSQIVTTCRHSRKFALDKT